VNEAVITAEGLIKRYGELVAVAGIAFEVRRGECFGFLGPNGAGKTTTMKMIYRATSVDAGSLRILGNEAHGGHRDREIKRRLGVVPQEDNLDQDLSVRENLEVFARFYRLKRRESEQTIDELLASLGLGEKSDIKTTKLSGGLKRRLQIARGLLGKPDILVLDEPTTGLDPQARHDLWKRLRELKQRRATLLLTTHYMDEAERLCDRIVIIDRGRIVAEGSPSELIAKHVPPHVVEIQLNGEAGGAQAIEPLREAAVRAEVLSDRVLLYTDRGEDVITEAVRRVPNHRSILRRSNLEDVFLQITGRELSE
jgi:lipooligosaccharide transport system ATP-binding protein